VWPDRRRHTVAVLGDREVGARTFEGKIPVAVADGVAERERRHGDPAGVASDPRELQGHRLNGFQRDHDRPAVRVEDVAVAQLAVHDDTEVGAVGGGRPNARASPFGVVDGHAQAVGRRHPVGDVGVVERPEVVVGDQHHCLLSAGAPTPSRSVLAPSQAARSACVTGSAR